MKIAVIAVVTFGWSYLYTYLLGQVCSTILIVQKLEPKYLTVSVITYQLFISHYMTLMESIYHVTTLCGKMKHN